MAFAEGTTVPTEKTRAEIERLVAKYGATRFASGWDGDSAAITFTAHGRMVRFTLKLPTMEQAKDKASNRRTHWSGPTPAQKQGWIDRESRRRWRCLLLAIKAKLEVVESGIATFEEEFLAHIVSDDGRFTIYERLQLDEDMPPLLGPVTP